MAKRRRITAEQLLAELATDRKFVELQSAEDMELRREEKQLARAQAPLLRDLNAAGAHLESVWNLVNTRRKYPTLIPVLLKHLDRKYPGKIREGIARALAVPGAVIGWNQLLRNFVAEPVLDERGHANQVKWALHLAIAAAADSSVVGDLVGLAADRRHGEHRSFFIDGLSRINDLRARAALEELKADPDLAEGFKRLAKRRKSKRA